MGEMTKAELFELLVREAKKLRKNPGFISINKHLTGIGEIDMPTASQIDGVLVAFINHIGMSMCIDFALSVGDLNKETKFKVGDKIRKINGGRFDKDMMVASIGRDYYYCNHIGKYSGEPIYFSDEDKYELVRTLK
jgi:hypothetical protein